jgi:hypothetical protein
MMRLEKHAARMKSCEMAYRRLVEKLKYYLEYVIVNGRIILKLTLRKRNIRARAISDWLRLYSLFCENPSLGSDIICTYDTQQPD